MVPGLQDCVPRSPSYSGMGRKPRIHYRSACYHVILRGNNRQEIFGDDFDRERFLRLVAEGVGRFEHRVHAFCLMPNHVHLAIEVASVPLSKIAHNFGFRYAQSFNRRYGSRGHLFENRYLGGLVETDGGMMRLVRYIHLNPVRAGMADSAASFPWSSHATYLGKDETSWLTSSKVLSLFSPKLGKARSLLREYLRDALKQSPDPLGPDGDSSEDTDSPTTLLTDRWEDEIPRPDLPLSYQMKGITADKVLAAVCDCAGVGVRELRSSSRNRPISEARALVAHLVRRSPHLTFNQLEAPLARHASTLCRAASRISHLRTRDPRLAELIDRIDARLGIPTAD